MKTTTATTAMMIIVAVDIPVLVEVGLVVVEVLFISLGHCNLPTV